MDEKEKKTGIMIVFGKKDDSSEKNNNKAYSGDDKENSGDDKEKKEAKDDEPKKYSLKDYGGYTPEELVSKLEEAKESIARSNSKEAIMALDSCIVRLTGKQLPENQDSAIESDPFYELRNF